MATAAGGRLIAAAAAVAAAKSQNRCLCLSSPHPEIKLFSSQIALRAALRHPVPLPLSLSLHSRRHFPSKFAARDGYSGSNEEEEEEEDVHEEQQDVEERAEQQQLEEYARSSSRETGRLYVGNLPFSMTSSEIVEIFGQAGNVVAVELITDRVTNRSRGFAFVTMATDKEANEAIRMFDGAQFGGRTAKVNFPEVPKGGEREVMESKVRGGARSYADSPYKIYAGNLGWTVTSDALRNAFSACSGVIGAKVIYERDTGRSRGFGFVAFASDDECQVALEAMDGKMVAGRPLRLNLAGSKTPSAVQSKAVAANFLEGNGKDADVDQESYLESNPATDVDQESSLESSLV